jgi:hypothetical protein
MKHNFKYFFFYFFSLCLGCILTSFIIYSRFIRERFPKDIPMFLTEYRFWILSYICCIYFYILISFLRNKKSNEIIIQIVDFLYVPLTNLDHFLKYTKSLKTIYYFIINKIIDSLQNITKKHIVFIIIIFEILPRSILLFFLYKDIFFIHKIEIFYKFILLGLIPFIFKYIVYSIKDIKRHYIEKLEEKYEYVNMFDESYTDPFIEWELTEENKLHNQNLSIKEYIEFKINEFYSITNTIYIQEPLAKEITYQQYRTQKDIPSHIDLNEKDYELIDKFFHDTLPLILHASYFLEIYAIAKEKKLIITLKMIIYFLYLVGWLYVLVISYYKYPINFPNTIMYINIPITQIEDPFAGIHL